MTPTVAAPTRRLPVSDAANDAGSRAGAVHRLRLLESRLAGLAERGEYRGTAWADDAPERVSAVEVLAAVRTAVSGADRSPPAELWSALDGLQGRADVLLFTIDPHGEVEDTARRRRREKRAKLRLQWEGAARRAWTEHVPPSWAAVALTDWYWPEALRVAAKRKITPATAIALVRRALKEARRSRETHGVGIAAALVKYYDAGGGRGNRDSDSRAAKLVVESHEARSRGWAARFIGQDQVLDALMQHDLQKAAREPFPAEARALVEAAIDRLAPLLPGMDDDRPTEPADKPQQADDQEKMVEIVIEEEPTQ